MAIPTHYAHDRMRAGGVATKSVLHLDSVQRLEIGVRLTVAGPAELGVPARERPLHLFNPSLVAAPAGLCARCTFVAAMRADPLHQCDSTSPLQTREVGMPGVVATNAWFKGTVIAVLDDDLKVIAWTWLLIDPAKQIEARLTRQDNGNRSGWFVPTGSADKFAPPWSELAIDARLFDLDGRRLFVTFVRSCHARQPCHFGVSQLQLTGVPTADGRIRSLRAWAYPTFTAQQAWAQGRNQALFSAKASGSSAGLRSLHVQPWPGLVATFGVPTFERVRRRCAPWAERTERGGRRGGVRGGFYPMWERRSNRAFCAATPPGTDLELEIAREGGKGRRGSTARGRAPDRLSALVRQPDSQGGTTSPPSALLDTRFGRLLLLANHTARLPRHEAGEPQRSLTTNLIRVVRRGGGTPCVALLGVGHVHRTAGACNIHMHIHMHMHTHSRSAPPGARAASPPCPPARPRPRPSSCTRATAASGWSADRCYACTAGDLLRAQTGRSKRGARSPLPRRERWRQGQRRSHNRRQARTADGIDGDGMMSDGASPAASAHPFKFGADYDHYLFTLQPTHPFAPLAVSDDFCVESKQDSTDCERVQFVSGMTQSPTQNGDWLLLAYGVNDCESRVGRIWLKRVWSMLKPLPGVADTCEPLVAA